MSTAESRLPESPDPELDPEEGPDLILVVDDDQDIASFVEFNLKVHGFEVIRARDGQEALELLEQHRPALAVVDWMMPRMDGVELIRHMRAEPLTSATPVIMLTAKSMTVDKVFGLTTGADDYLVKPFDTAELLARVTTTLRRNKDAREVSPLTGLPGNARVRREIGDRMRSGGDYSVGYIDVDRFKSVNDVYGFDRGDEFIIALARSLQRASAQTGKPSIFLGHIGGDDFVFICHPDQVLPLTQRTVTDFEAAADRLYEPEDARRGYIEVPDRRGNKQKAALVTLSIGVAQATNDGRRFTDPRVVIGVASEMKKVAKSQPGSYVAIDRRRSEAE
ncbi:diguanylate cyclase (GGDEF)-like protein [Actinoplanes campanulatus]|uniref:Diguanylate cyclase (GGDEF)-like protein n=1 Tax=Actinoplanes campanulatus TaxID=113559 RepID=A0A7W5AQV2_9ACTN|nr:response regulator [Actinoplanes campanulatus]MBB3100595.1 diguanylate cyclase (GGDEF)-like protein [Actinoplanes campanulatus]GGN44978.1 diguanylate cyclase response regulator [Actinoplanes campanulatus]GID40973.1 diguanylate cyclase response regulator [Actinoplanes campanulatus]